METGLVAAKGGGGMDQELEVGRCTTIYKTEEKQGPTVQHREIYSIFYDNPNEKRI